MGKYTVIAEVGARVKEILAEGLVPDLIQDENGVGLCSPAEKGDFVLGIYLYDIRENSDVRMQGMIDRGVKEQKFPSAYLSLYYMLTAYSASDVKFRSSQEQRILGKSMQLLADHTVIPIKEVGEGLGGMDLRIDFLDMTIEDKMKIWNDNSRPYRTSLFYRVAPVELESLKTKRITRVTEIDMTLQEQGDE
ncbi:MAG: DUF4255 domain-containing protein [Hungatella sp.]